MAGCIIITASGVRPITTTVPSSILGWELIHGNKMLFSGLHCNKSSVLHLLLIARWTVYEWIESRTCTVQVNSTRSHAGHFRTHRGSLVYIWFALKEDGRRCALSELCAWRNDVFGVDVPVLLAALLSPAKVANPFMLLIQSCRCMHCRRWIYIKYELIVISWESWYWSMAVHCTCLFTPAAIVYGLLLFRIRHALLP